MTVSTLIALAFRSARARHPELHKVWTGLSHRVGGLLPSSLLNFSIQRIGELDVVIRCCEEDLLKSQHDPNPIPLEPFHYQAMLSELWVGSIYESIRVLVDKDAVAIDHADLNALAHDLRLLRIPLEKYQIAADKKLTAPLTLIKTLPNNDRSDLYHYSKEDPMRAHIMPTGISQCGSVMWQTIDVKSGKSLWIERRSLSERAIAILSEITRLHLSDINK